MGKLTVDLPDSIPAEEARLRLAMALYSAGRISQGQAATLAGCTRATFIELLGRHGHSFTNISPDDLTEELARWHGLPSRTARP